MSKFTSPALLACALAAASTLFVAAAQGTAGHAGHSMSMPAPTSVKAVPLPLSAQQATVVAVPPTGKETSAFVTFKNAGKQAVRLTGVSSPVAASSMLMHTLTTGNMIGMVAAPALVVPAGGTLTLGASGDHIMLVGLKRALKPGESVPITVTDAAGRRLTFQATVTKP